MKRPQGVDYAWAASKLNEFRHVQSDGNIVFKSHGLCDFHEIIGIIGTHHDFGEGIPDIECRRIITTAVLEAAKNGSLTDASLKGEILRQSNAYKSRPIKQFVLLTSMSVPRPPALTRKAFHDATFFFSDTLPSGITRDGLNVFEFLKPPNDLPKSFTIVRVRVKARSEFEAYDLGINALDCLRGMWNFRINRAIASRINAGVPSKPVNRIRLGPVHSLHDVNGEIATGIYWYDQLTYAETICERVKDWAAVQEEEAKLRHLLSLLAYPEFMKQAFVRYTRSLDSSDHDSSFVKLWSLMEYLTVMRQDENYGEMINRVLFLHADEEYHRQVLEHLRARRNASVHRGESSSEMEAFVFQLKQYVERLMAFHLEIRRQYKSPEEAAELLTRSRNPQELRKQIAELKLRLSLAKRALQIHEALSTAPSGSYVERT